MCFEEYQIMRDLIMEYLSIQLDVYRDKSSKPQILTFRPNEYFDESMFNAIEKANKDLIVEYEIEKGWR